MKCAYCNKEIERKIDSFKLKRNKLHFCDKKCKALFQQKQNLIVEKEDYAEIHIEKDNKSLIVLIDKDDIEKVQKFKWNVKYDKTIDNYYVYSHERNNYINRKTLRLHRFLMNCPKDLQVDHVNRNTLDNRKCNLKVCTLQENLNNKGEYKNNTSGYKNIHYSKANKTFVCEIKRNNKMVFYKTCKNLEELVKLRDKFLESEVMP